MKGAFIAGGKERAVDAVVHTWLSTGLHFVCKTRKATTRVVVNHWTGAENPPHRLHDNMRNRVSPVTGRPEPLSVHFACDAFGELWQYADTEAFCAHCKAHGMNSCSVGIEFICRGDNFAAQQQGIIRQRSMGVIHGEQVAYDDLTPAQIAAGVALNEALCSHYNLPLQVPEKDGQLVHTELAAKLVARFTGAAGHFHFERKKRDPGLALLLAIQARGRALPRPVA